ncbi:MAG: 30S ribosomal protein S17e [Candidatus Thermoplasmatota archaeon]|nr:30S ribosomal protein S17e [Candidatus Thermoplasmatota archaeon]
MGNIRPTYIKRAAVELVKRYPDRFSDDFEENKKVMAELAHFQSHSLRNKVAGYIIRHRKVLQRME